jgi:hypothetical protein
MGGRKNRPPVRSESRVHLVTPARPVAWSVTTIQRSSLTAVVKASIGMCPGELWRVRHARGRVT